MFCKHILDWVLFCLARRKHETLKKSILHQLFFIPNKVAQTLKQDLKRKKHDKKKGKKMK